MMRTTGAFQESLGKADSKRGVGFLLAHSTLANCAGQLILLSLVFVTTPYIVQQLGDRAYGALTLVLTFVNMLSLFQFGLNTSLVTFVAKSLSQGDLEQARVQVRTGLGFFLVLATAAGAVTVLPAGWWMRVVFSVPPDLQSQAISGFYIASAALWIRLAADSFAAVPIAAQRFDLVNLIFVGTEVFRTIGSIAALVMGAAIPGVCAVVLAANVLFLLSHMIVARRLIPQLSPVPALSRPVLAKLFRFSKYVFISNVSSRAVHSLDHLLVSYLLPIRYLAFYTIAYALAQKLWILAGNVTTAVYPASCALSGPDGAERLRVFYLRTSKIVAALAGVSSIGLLVMARPILLYWMGPEFADNATRCLELLAAGFLLNILAHIPGLLCQSQDRPDLAAKFAAANALLNVPLFCALIPPFGIAGAAAGFAVTQLILTPYFIHVTNRLVGVAWKDVIAKSYARPVLAWMLAGLLFAMLRGHVHSLTSLALLVLLGGCAAMILVWLIVLDQKEREPFRAMIEAAFARRFHRHVRQ